jgi:hypothetical protein
MSPPAPATALSLAALAALATVFALCVSCGYAPVYPTGGSDRLHVKLTRSLVADAVAADEVAQGAREELARQGALEGGEGYPRLEIEVLRADETSAGVAAAAGTVAGLGARATAVALVARGRVVEQAGDDPVRDSGDVRAEAAIAVDETNGAAAPVAGSFHFADALRSVARGVGSKIARRAMGLPAAGE